jgi:hypothetical protein
MGSWVRIPLEAWIPVGVSSMFVLCVGSGLATGLIPVPGVLLTLYKIDIVGLLLLGKGSESPIRNAEEEKQ